MLDGPFKKLLRTTTLFAASGLWIAGSVRAADSSVALERSVDAGGPLPATTFQATSLIDLMTFPRMKALKIGFEQPTSLMYSVDAKLDDVMAFYRKQLSGAKWKDETEPGAQGYSTWTNSGYRLQVSAYDDGEGHLSVSLTNLGNFDVRRLPRLPEGKVDYEGFSGVMYTAEAAITDLELFCLRSFRKQGWHVCSRMDSQGTEEPDVRHLSFIQNGIEATVFIRRSPDAPNKFVVQYSAGLLPLSVPAPDDTDWMELSTGRFQSVYLTKLDAEQTAAFLADRMPEHGWQPTDKGGRNLKIFSRKEGFLPVRLAEIEGGTRVEFGSGFERLSWLLRNEQPQTEPEADTDAAQKEQAGVEAAEIPLRDDAKEVKRDRDSKQISFHTAENVASNVTFYSALMTKWGFQLDGKGVDADDFALKEFKNGEQEITLRCALHSADVFRVSLDGDGIQWSKPLPSDNDVVSYETWLKRKQMPPSLEHLETFAKEMSGKK